MITFYFISAFLAGLGAFPIYMSFKKGMLHRSIKKIKRVNSVDDAVKETIPHHSICPFGTPCLIYDERRTKEALERLLDLMKTRIKKDLETDPK